MTRLRHLASSVKSANAGASAITMEVGFDDRDGYRRVCDSRLLTAEPIGRLYRVPSDEVQVYEHDLLSMIKVTIPRRTFGSQLEETDFDGVQQHVPLLDIDVEEQP